jgi:hypothetical protein
MVLNAIEWHASGGVIDAFGRFNAGNDEGAFSLEAVSSAVRGTANITISKADAPGTTKPGSELIRGISWSGEIPLQKWMNFYSKVLARFATAGGIKLRVSLEVSPEGGLPEQKVEETNAALRELGVEGEVEKRL